MNHPNDLEPAGIRHPDYQSAYRLLIATAPGRADQVAINAALEDIDLDRVSQLLMALCNLAHFAGPHLRTDESIAAMQALIAQSARDADQ